MIETLISSKTRIKLLLKFFLNSSTKAYLRGLESEFGESSNAIRLELNRFENAGMLTSELAGNKKVFTANTRHPLFDEVHNILLKYVGLDQVIDKVIIRLGDVDKVYVTGSFAQGKDSLFIDLVFIGHIKKAYLIELIDKVEDLIDRKLRYVVFKQEEEAFIDWSEFDCKPLLLWTDGD